ncbi:hypothetical protein [Nitratireductor sp.]|uniref:hypothetical protein n=1 Tax=Nitratireductor sp. TaxID=1872084 RepID=UPI0026167619|nr:hypothetical protein [Nitratireductor sp.]MCV0381270.1 hypothetical protein [Nitratireductor sp.]
MPPALSLFDVLPDFGAPTPPPSPGDHAADHGFNPLSQPDEQPVAAAEPVRPLQTQTDELIAAAQIALAERLSREHAEAMEQERQRHADEMDALRAQLGEAAGQTITQHFTVLENQLVELATQATARMLGSVLTEDLQKRSIAELERVVRSAIDDREALRIRVSGSPALWEALKAGLGEKASHVDFAEAPGFDISVTIDEELFETRLTEWSETLAGLIS